VLQRQSVQKLSKYLEVGELHIVGSDVDWVKEI
jgi:hypothetical protein